MKYALIDIGSNSIRMNVYNKDNIKKEVFSKKYMAGLADFVEDGKLSKKGEKKLMKVLSSQKLLLNYLPIDDVYVFASASLRNVENGEEIAKKIKKELDLNVDIITAEKEAYYGVLGVMEKYDFKKFYAVDIGGGSTEFTYVKDGNVKGGKYLKIGSLSLFRDYVENIVPNDRELESIYKRIDEEMGEIEVKADTLVSTGGTARAIGNILEEIRGGSNELYNAEEVADFICRMKSRDNKTMLHTIMVVPERLHTITTGAAILYSIMKKLGVQSTYVSKYGVREGYLKEKIKEN